MSVALGERGVRWPVPVKAVDDFSSLHPGGGGPVVHREQ
jgi:hypothetical protein